MMTRIFNDIKDKIKETYKIAQWIPREQIQNSRRHRNN
jgi:hypothetical protein